jgi:hypothetical protein
MDHIVPPQNKYKKIMTKNLKNKIIQITLIILLIVTISRSFSTRTEKTEDNLLKLLNFPPTLEKNPVILSDSNKSLEIESNITKWEIYNTWQKPDYKIYYLTSKIEIPKNAKAIKAIVTWEGTSFLVKGYGELEIDIIKLVKFRGYSEEVSVSKYSTDISNNWILDSEGSKEFLAYVENNAQFYQIQLMKANIGDCIMEVYFGY